MPTFNKTALQGYLFSLHQQRMSVKAAHAKLLELTKEEIFNMHDVQDLFYRIDNGNYDMMDRNEDEGGEWEQDPRLLLENLPGHINEKIVELLGFEARMTFRKTSTQFRNLVDTGTFHIDLLEIQIYPNDISILIDSVIRCYEHLMSGVEACVVNSILPNKVSLVNGKRFTDCVGTDLKSIFRNKYLTVTKLKVIEVPGEDRDHRFDQFAGHVFNNLREAMSAAEKKPKIEKISSECSDNWCLEIILPHVDPSVIEYLSDELNHESMDGTLKPDERMFELEQWKNLNAFSSHAYFQVEKFEEHFSHFSYCKFKLDNHPTVEQVLRMKENLLRNPKLAQIKIDTEMRIEDFNEINKRLRTFNFVGTRNPSWAHFDYPNFDGRLSLRVTDKMIWFRGPEYEEEGSDIEYSDSEDDDDNDDDDDRDDSDSSDDDSSSSDESSTDEEDHIHWNSDDNENGVMDSESEYEYEDREEIPIVHQDPREVYEEDIDDDDEKGGIESDYGEQEDDDEGMDQNDGDDEDDVDDDDDEDRLWWQENIARVDFVIDSESDERSDDEEDHDGRIPWRYGYDNNLVYDDISDEEDEQN